MFSSGRDVELGPNVPSQVPTLAVVSALAWVAPTLLVALAVSSRLPALAVVAAPAGDISFFLESIFCSSAIFAVVSALSSC